MQSLEGDLKDSQIDLVAYDSQDDVESLKCPWRTEPRRTEHDGCKKTWQINTINRAKEKSIKTEVSSQSFILDPSQVHKHN